MAFLVFKQLHGLLVRADHFADPQRGGRVVARDLPAHGHRPPRDAPAHAPPGHP